VDLIFGGFMSCALSRGDGPTTPSITIDPSIQDIISGFFVGAKIFTNSFGAVRSFDLRYLP
jgi:hypothetical protein